MFRSTLSACLNVSEAEYVVVAVRCLSIRKPSMPDRWRLVHQSTEAQRLCRLSALYNIVMMPSFFVPYKGCYVVRNCLFPPHSEAFQHFSLLSAAVSAVAFFAAAAGLRAFCRTCVHRSAPGSAVRSLFCAFASAPPAPHWQVKLAVHVLFHHESAYRHAVVGTPSAVLHIYSDGNFGVVHRRKAHEYGVVATVVLRRTGLAARLKVVFREHSARSAESRRAHSCHHIVVCPACGFGVVAARIGGVERFALHLPHHMWGRSSIRGWLSLRRDWLFAAA